MATRSRRPGAAAADPPCPHAEGRCSEGAAHGGPRGAAEGRVRLLATCVEGQAAAEDPGPGLGTLGGKQQGHWTLARGAHSHPAVPLQHRDPLSGLGDLLKPLPSTGVVSPGTRACSAGTFGGSRLHKGPQDPGGGGWGSPNRSPRVPSSPWRPTEATPAWVSWSVPGVPGGGGTGRHPWGLAAHLGDGEAPRCTPRRGVRHSRAPCGEGLGPHGCPSRLQHQLV